MTKTKWYILGSVFLALVVAVSLVSIKRAKAETSTTFPVGEAGIAAYVKLDNIENIDIDALAEALYTVEKQAESYVIGTVLVDNYAKPSYPHLYIGMDGWIVAYYLKTEEASRIMQWRDYVPGSINTTTLKDAIDEISQKIGVTYSTPIKYYDFEFPDANKMTLIAERVLWSPWGSIDSNNFSATVPGTLYEASYTINARYCGYSPMSLKVDDITVLDVNLSEAKVFSGYFDTSTYFKAGVSHYVTYYFRSNIVGCYGGLANVLIYKN